MISCNQCFSEAHYNRPGEVRVVISTGIAVEPSEWIAEHVRKFIENINELPISISCECSADKTHLTGYAVVKNVVVEIVPIVRKAFKDFWGYFQTSAEDHTDETSTMVQATLVNYLFDEEGLQKPFPVTGEDWKLKTAFQDCERSAGKYSKRLRILIEECKPFTDCIEGRMAIRNELNLYFK